MNVDWIRKKLDELRAIKQESECVEFKEAKTSFDSNNLGQYFSALCNEANLHDRSEAWLIFGVKSAINSTTGMRDIIGSNYRNSEENLNKLKQEVAQKTTGGISFQNIFTVDAEGGRVVLFQIPPAPRGIPIAWAGHYYGRDNESLVALNIEKIERIRSVGVQDDWSSGICKGAKIDDLDTVAIEEARRQYAEKNPKLKAEMGAWDETTFLNKAKLTVDGKISRTAMLLLGKNESAHHLLPYIPQITWTLRDEKDMEKDYEHFGLPFILSVNQLFQKIRNTHYRYLPDNTLFPKEITQYDPWVIREALHNCIAHQDYRLKERIVVVERPDQLTFKNAGSFIPESVDKVIKADAPPRYYRNAFLAHAMVNLNLVDTIGGGIKKMFMAQRNRCFPLPTYEIAGREVSVSITGRALNNAYTQLLLTKKDFDLSIVILLDKVQKSIRLSKDEFQFLKRKKLIEGRYPNAHISSDIASVVDGKAEYIKKRGFDKEYYQKLIVEYLEEYKQAGRRDIDDLLMNKLPDVLSQDQKRNRIRNLLYELSKKLRCIKNIGSSKKPQWVLSKRVLN